MRRKTRFDREKFGKETPPFDRRNISGDQNWCTEKRLLKENIVPSGAGSHIALPTVSVCVGCFNQEAFIDTAIRSVAAQTYTAFECVVVDDFSTDGSRRRIEECLSQLGDSRFRFLPRLQNGGQLTVMMTGLDATAGPLISFLDGDDAWHPDFIECHVRAHLSQTVSRQCRAPMRW
ncbi:MULTISPECIES: glycosyltransferase family 2 protein [unclassified Mesorhizobium]|uniref:glycosyltransferase family 2 protein n=1 Tax=unclassified Mesorhizobium TaxID=325217 RepID=UPI0009FE7E36